MELLLIRDGDTLRPAFDKDREAIGKVKDGDTVAVELRRPRNVGFHRKFFGLLDSALYHMPEKFSQYKTVDALLLEIKLQLGMFDPHVTLGGKTTYVPRSISFAKMDEDEFEKFYSSAFDIILKHFLKGIDEKAFEAELLNFM